MPQKLKNYLFPSASNDYRPGLLRAEALSLVLGLIIFVEIIFLVPTYLILPSERYGAAVLPAVLVDLANADRNSMKLPELRLDPLLAKAAQLKAEDMARRGYFSHNDPDGHAPWQWLDRVGYKYAYAGENLAINFFDSADIERAWMESSLHRDNILKKQFSEIGIGTAKGRYDGYETIFVVQFFARPSGGVALNSMSDIGLDQSFQSGNQNQMAAAGLLDFPTGKQESSFLLRLIGSPRTLTNAIFAVLILLVLLVSLFIFLHRGSRQDRQMLLANAVLILLLIMSVVLLNYKISASRAEVAVRADRAIAIN